MKKILILIATTLSPLSANVPNYITNAALEKCDKQAIIAVLALDNITKENLEEAIKKAKFNLQRTMSLEDLTKEKKSLETFLLLKEAYGIKYPDASDNKYYQALKQHLTKDDAALSNQQNANALLADLVEAVDNVNERLSITNTNAKKLKILQKDTNIILDEILRRLQSIPYHTNYGPSKER